MDCHSTAPDFGKQLFARSLPGKRSGMMRGCHDLHPSVLLHRAAKDIATIARWIWKIIVKNQPNNKAVERYVQGALRQGPSAEMIHANQCFPDSPKR
eukprot:1162008-Pelagomonas_calceolata.AAC.2